MTQDSSQPNGPDAGSERQDPPGLDLGRLGPWFAENVPGAGDSLSARHISGGKSNLTYEVSDGTTSWIIRRPPLGHVLATAHDMGREYTVMTALRDTPVPVPTTYARCQDESVTGADFYVMEKAAGVPYRFATELEGLGKDRTRDLSSRLVDILAALHQVDPASVGLGEFGRPEGFLGRQVKRWKKQLEASYSRDLPAADELHRRLAESIPAEQAPGIIHGDYRLDNVLTDSSGDSDEITAVIDWEMATLGDPLTDLALMILYKRLGDQGGSTVADASSAPGFLSEQEIVDLYARTSTRDLSDFGWYLGLAAYKLGAILEGIHYRYINGQTVGPGFDKVGDSIHGLLQTGLDALDAR
ncbi:phosphotransferase family protein [Nocardioides insulae]|uniref:phosphotransferase family protein n=1 Tax=Nocardioides insulae TaxID=394734 RepID=UPI0006881907|nr:phosphotransferase family protein [Nocardioides insulae]